ncbi:hypothetical protein MXX24_25745, partial [Klebsiella pneumoniae]|uniref:hypothetical protein n=1 Tax=Klebsiella pneumoniae TaxID=573 RepID=UPI0024063A2B
LERWIKGSAILGCVGCLVGHLFMFLVGGKTPDQSVHLNLTTTVGLPIMATTLRFVLQAASAPAIQRLPPGGNLNDFA